MTSLRDQVLNLIKGGQGSGNFHHTGQGNGEVGGSGKTQESDDSASHSGVYQNEIEKWQQRNISIAMQSPKTNAPKNLQKYIDDAYLLGKKARQSGYTSASQYALYHDPIFEEAIMKFDKPEFVAFEAGLRENEKPYWVNGWRYGKISSSGSSMNFAEGKLESGISVMATDNGMATKSPSFEMFGGSRGNQDRIFVSGFLNTNTTGGDGEPLLLWAKQTGNVSKTRSE